MNRLHTLTGNELARVENAISHAINWHKKEGVKSDFTRKSIADLKALLAKLTAISDRAYPYAQTEATPLDYGDEPIMRTDASVIKRTRATAHRHNRTFAADRHVAAKAGAL